MATEGVSHIADLPRDVQKEMETFQEMVDRYQSESDRAKEDAVRDGYKMDKNHGGNGSSGDGKGKGGKGGGKHKGDGGNKRNDDGRRQHKESSKRRRGNRTGDLRRYADEKR